jgi:hypothetical protein
VVCWLGSFPTTDDGQLTTDELSEFGPGKFEKGFVKVEIPCSHADDVAGGNPQSETVAVDGVVDVADEAAAVAQDGVHDAP